ncbi:hypothetical protein [Leucobacter aridicollis]|uniref:Uncharacterized protein n=1 Tax=Leucobacter aridicollis TaxID=283878 RepID=A0A852QYY4_9MICO|nr:hypothetical protein [Leucobacter aridicollis]MBL3683169.1 hypothetical protein [Leucobacter aridicollis]NYD25397.1 hypothetical protein [Leucobacter aridicollis]
MSVTDHDTDSQQAELSPATLLAAGDIVGLMRACHDRRLEREGIPMVIGLVDERGSIPVVADAPQRGEGAEFARILDEYSAVLTPWGEDLDEGSLITAMQVLAYTHFAPGAAPLQDPEASTHTA